jgi:predicted nucleotidyltransferase
MTIAQAIVLVVVCWLGIAFVTAYLWGSVVRVGRGAE